MKKFWQAMIILTMLTAFSFLADAQVNAFMTGLRSPLMDSVMFFFTALGGLTIGLPFIVLMVVMLEMKHKGKAAANLITALAVDIVITTLLKFIVGRDRPVTAITDPTDATEAYMSSFPSGHSSRAFTMFSTLNKYYRNPMLFYSIALLVAFSRLYFGVHYLSDVLAGVTIGLIVSHEICRRDIGTKIIRRFKNKR